jgi:hypothetical protein
MRGRPSRSRREAYDLPRFALHPAAGGTPIPKRDTELCSGGPFTFPINITSRVRRVLGLGTGTTLPANFATETVIDGRRVIIKKSTPGSSIHRMFIETNDGRMVPTGRLRQAVCPRRSKS